MNEFLAAECSFSRPLLTVVAPSMKPQRETMGLLGRIENAACGLKFRGREDLNGACVLVVDDFRTSGATVEEMRRLMMESGAARVVTLTLGTLPMSTSDAVSGEDD
ncbi:MAG: hypothetical protein ACKVPX_05315 [Myxococcaceae bacterium]